MTKGAPKDWEPIYSDKGGSAIGGRPQKNHRTGDSGLMGVLPLRKRFYHKCDRVTEYRSA